LVALTGLPVSVTCAMDGWAVAGGRGPWRLVASALAGHPPGTRLSQGTAAVIGTGGVVPVGTDGIIRSEHGHVLNRDGESWVFSSHIPDPGDIRPAGAETQTGEILLPAGTRLTPPQVGLAAAVGYDTLRVHRRPIAQFIVLGDEILRRGVPGAGQVRDSLGPALPGFATALGCATRAGTAAGPVSYTADRLADIVRALRLATADVVITTGGTAAGPADFLHAALAALGARLVIDSVAMRPGHPCLLAALGERRFVVGLPGNPLAAMAGMLTLAAPLVRALSGQPPIRYGEVLLGELVVAPPQATRLVPYALQPGADGRPHAYPTQWLGSGMLRGLAMADGVAAVPPGGALAGTPVTSVPLPW
jgi:molybdopterin molybdotransferase